MLKLSILVFGLGSVLGLSGLAFADGGSASAGSDSVFQTECSFEFDPGEAAEASPLMGMLSGPTTLAMQDSGGEDEAIEAAAPRFGSKGSRRFNIHAGYGVHVKSGDNTLALAGVGWSWFIDENISFDLELNGIGFWQEVEDAAGINMNLLFRWHFHAEETWSLYFEGGAGMLATTKDVPAHGSSFNFTPQAGFGASFEVGEENRMMVGVRWHHVSNANIYDENPGRDSVMGYVGLSMPF